MISRLFRLADFCAVKDNAVVNMNVSWQWHGNIFIAIVIVNIKIIIGIPLKILVFKILGTTAVVVSSYAAESGSIPGWVSFLVEVVFRDFSSIVRQMKEIWATIVLGYHLATIIIRLRRATISDLRCSSLHYRR